MCKQGNLYFKKNIFFPSVFYRNREVCCAGFVNIKMLLLKIEPMIISTILSVNQKPGDKMTSFHDTLCYSTCVTEENLLRARGKMCIFVVVWFETCIKIWWKILQGVNGQDVP